jgi:4-amino-4-deoxy-L-arabinose transferase-like glycosyltransferase
VSAWLDDISQGDAKYGLTVRAWIVLFVVSLAALLPGLFTIPSMDRDESRYAQASRQMMETGDFVDIRFQDDPRYVKPAGIYWMQVITTTPFGGPDAPIGAYRLPSFLASLAAIGLTALMGARLFSPTVGFVAAIVVAVSFMTQIEARTAKTDAALLAAAMMAQYGLIMILTQVKEVRPKFWGLPALMWIGTGLALLMKGPIVAMFTAFTLFGYVALKRDVSLIWKTRPLIGLAVAGAIFLPWLVAINIQTNWDFFREAVGHAMFEKVGTADDSHGGPFGYHTLLIPVTLWPGAALVGLAGLVAWNQRKNELVQLLLLWILPGWLVFEIVQTKLPHYVLPAVPAIALLMGLGVERAPELLSGVKQRVMHWTLVSVTAIVALVLGAIPHLGAPQIGASTSHPIFDLSLVFGGFAAATVFGLGYLKDLRGVLLSSVGAIGSYTIVLGVIIPNLDEMWPSHRASIFVSTLEGCEDIQVVTGGYREPSNVFNFGTDTILARDGAEAAAALIAAPQCRVAVIDEAVDIAFGQAIRAQGSSVVKLGDMPGFNAVKGDELFLSFYLAEGSELSLPAQID